MTQAHLADGTILDFPDGTDGSVIDRVVKEHLSTSQNSEHNQEPQPKEGIARTALDQGLQGATFGFADEITDRMGAGIASAGGAGKYDDLLKEARRSTGERQQRQTEQHPLVSLGANIAGGLLTGGAAAETKAGGALANSLRTGNIGARVVKGALSGAASGAAYGAGSAADGNKLEGAGKGALIGGAVGGAVPLVAAGASKVKGAVMPRIEGATLELAQRARDLGVPLRLDQVSPTRVRSTVQKISQEIPFSGADAFEEGQRQAFTKAVAKTIGQDSSDLSPETINNFLEDAGKKFSAAVGNQDIQFTSKDLNKIGDIVESSKEKITGDLVGVVKSNVDKFMKDSQFEFGKGRTINSEKLASLRSQILKDLPSIQGGAKQQVSKLIDEIDNVVGRQISPEQAATLSQARLEWRNFKTIEPLLDKSTDGTINPTELLNRVKSSKYIKASRSSVGEDDLVDLARIGKKFLPKKGGSDTFQKSALTGGVAGLGVTALANPLLALGVATKAGVGIAANRGLQEANSSQRLVDLAIKSSRNTVRQFARRDATRLLEGQAGSAASRK